MAFVVVFPEFVTVWKFGDVPDGQLVPFAKQTFWPFTISDEPDAVPNVNEEPKSEVAVAAVAVRLEDVRFVIVPLVAKKLAPVADTKESEVTDPFVDVRFVIPPLVAKRFVEVVFVPVAFVQVIPDTARGAVSVRFAIVAFVAAKLVANPFVVVAFVEVTFVKTPVDGTVAPIVVPLIEPPEIVAFDEMSVGAVRVLIVPERAFTVVPLAVAKLNDPVEVPLVKERFVMAPFVELRLVMVPFVVKKLVVVAFVPMEFVKRLFVAKRFVDVVFVPVALVQVRLANDDGTVEETVNDDTVKFVMVALVAVRFVALLFVLVVFVTTSDVPVALVNVVFWRFEVPVTVRFETVAPPYSVNVAVATEPRLVTVRSVSDSPETAGQFVPFARQTA